MVSFFRRGAIVPLLASIVSSSPTPTLAQLTPDATLGSQTSQVNSIGSVDTITGGVQSGRALFHSFLDFNVSPGRSLYFQDPGVSHIFTRVTGRQPSQIQGKLGVVGEANLVLLNPNGILFGTGASLDLRGSFTATTAPTLKFLGGQEFSATAPQAAPLLTLSVPIGVQLGDPTPGSRITNRGTLVTGQDLSLSSDRLDLQGSLQAGRDLSLRALDTVQVRDTLAQPFLAKAGRNLEIQGDRGIDILALNHVQAPAFQSGNTLSLISDGLISGDARFSSQGNLQMRSRSGGLAKFTSLYDPILSTVGDVDLALDYTGASLLIEAGGNIRIQGRVEITTPDGAAPLLGEDAVLNQKPGLILRSGQTNLRYSGNSDSVPGSTAGLGLLSDPGITLGGDVVVSADGVIRLTSDNGGDLRTQLLRTERGEITLISDRNLTTNGQLVDVATYSGDGGQITATARSGNLSLGELRAFSQDVDRETRGGTIDLKAAGDVVLQAVDTTAYQGKGGNLTIAAGGKLTLASVATYGLISGDSGAVNLTAGDRTELGTIDTSAVTGRSGDVTVTTQGDLFIQNQLETSIYIQGRAGDINLAVRSLFLRDGAQIRSNSAYGGAGDSGKIAIAARDRIEMTGFGAGNRPTAIFNLVDLYSTGTGNDITITTGSLIMRDGSEILANNFGNGNGTRAGNITIQARDRISLQGSRYWPGNNEETGTGIGSNIAKGGLIQEGGLNRQGGTIDIQAQNLELLDGAYIATRLEKLSDGQSGNIRLKLGNAAQPGTLLLRGRRSEILSRAEQNTVGNSGNIEIEAGSIALQDRAVISVEANGIGNGGQIRLSANQLTVDNSLINAETTQVGQAGTIRLEGDRLSLSQGGQIRSRTSGTGNAGEIQIGSLTRPMPQVQLAGAGSAILADTQAGATGQGGNISLFAGELVIQDQARISAATAGQGNGGSLLLRAEAIALTRGGAIANGVMANATGKGGSIDLATTSLTLTQGGNVQARTLGLGRAGDILVQAETIAISDNLSGIISGSGSPIARQLGLGAGGTIQLFTDRLHISNDGIVSASTFSSGRSGNLEVQAGSIDLNSQGRLSATTQSRGSAGMIWVNARDRVTITGARSGLFANTTESSTGDGGSIFLSTPRLQLQDQARITADSRGSGKGGGIQLITDHLSLTNRSTIFAGTTSTQGGNIDIQARDRLTLRNNSSISASAGTAGAGGNGGNIGIQAGFVIAQLQENSDITANAFAGNGGQVNITADAIFGLQFQPRLTPTSDITASSQLGLSGTVTLNTLRIDPNQGLVALPSSLVDSSQHIAQACSGQQAGNQFVITGRGGLSPDPTEALNQTGLWQDPTVPIVATSPPSAQISPRSWRAEKPPDRPIAEANRWRKAADGTVSLVVDLGSVRGSDPAIAPQTCRMPKQEVQ